MEYPAIKTKDLKIIYKAICDKMGQCINEMVSAIRNDDVERYVFVSEQYTRLRVMRTHYLQKIDIIKENLTEVLDIAEEVREINILNKKEDDHA